MSKKGSAPIRTCVGCRKRREKEEMIWFTLCPQGLVKVNPRMPHQGRGFYLCPDLGCVQRAKKKNREVGFLETTELQILFGKSILRVGNGIEEEGNDKK
ncbi:MAG: hypothetical protein A2026_13740 [Deltaproteobacteria bacterium RBG_19FT_COMBO_46_12]|nr:MAG: hypothetical protein A2026_13740 [Deltaproteobacteria bacterium RBG_19FT_COMBO_46_12]